MKFTSPRRGILAVVAAIVSAVLILPSGAATADEETGQPMSEVATMPSTTPAEPSASSDSTDEESSQTPDAAATTPAETATPEDAPSAEADATLEESVNALDEPTALNAPANSGTPLVCEPGYVYSIGANGAVYQINNNGVRTNIGSMGAGTDNYNGIGVGDQGSPVYAHQRIQSRNVTTGARIIRWDGPGSQAQEVATTSIELGGSLVAGAVDLNTGAYYFGGYEQYTHNPGFWQPSYNAHRLKIWRYVPGTGVNFVGEVDTGISTGTINQANGDFAFNQNGDLFFLISGNRTAIGTITAQELAQANGGKLNSSLTNTMTLSGDGRGANGIAFDADGSIYLGTGTHLYKYDPTTWRAIGQPQQALSGSTDLAGCNSPSSLEVTKNVEDRKDDSDQFELTVQSGSETFATATTEGNTTGVQRQQIGPAAVLFGETYSVHEAMASGSASTMSADYESSYVCTDGDGWQISGEGTEFDVTVTKPGQSISCEFTNAPLADTELTLIKEFDTSFGAPEDTDEWTLTATPPGGSALEFEHQETKEVDAGDYTISELFGDDQTSPETAGYTLADITCTSDGQDNPVNNNGTVTLENRTSTDCVLTNKDRPGSVVWEKTDTDGQYLSGSEWTLTGPAGFGDNGSIVVTDNGEYDADDRDGYFQVDHLWWGDYVLEETVAPDGYELLEENAQFTITGTDRDRVFSAAFENIAIPTLTLLKGFDTSYGAPENPDEWNLFATAEDDELAFDHGETHQVAEGEYVLSETFGVDGLAASDVGYELHEIVCSVDGGNERVLDGALTIERDTATECTLINVDLPGAVEWKKTNAEGTALSDSEWLLSGPDGFDDLDVVDNGEWDVDETAGTIRVEGLHWGDYTLEETQAPAGFQLISGTEDFTVSGTAREYIFDASFVNEPLQPGELPLTGVFTGKWPLIGAAALALLVLAGFAWSLRHRQTN